MARLRLLLRLVSALLIGFAIVALVRGGLSFTSPARQISSDMYAIRHTLILPSSFIIVGVVGVLLFVLSFLIRRDRDRV